ncbi:MAG: DEAD/DEAH box helicase [Synergistaceae bacterium]|nr:DEAD/DEAH box helicase [Synergistaceae bacterium]
MASLAYEIIAVFTRDGFALDTAPAPTKDCYFDQAMLDAFASDKYKALYDFGFAEKSDPLSPSLAYLRYISREFSKALSRDSDIEITRRAPRLQDETKHGILRAAPFGTGIEFIDGRWAEDIWNRLSAVFERDVKARTDSIADYLKGKNSSLNVVGRVFFHLVENKRDDSPFAFLSTYSTGTEEKTDHLPLKNALLEYGSDQDKLLALLATVSRAADRSEFISGLVESGELFSPLRFDAEEAYTFLREVPVYEECGIICRIPDWWKKKGSVAVSVSIGNTAPSMVGTEALLAFDPEIYLNDLQISKEEIQNLLQQADGLSLIKGKWVEVDHDKLRAALDAFDRAASMGNVTFADAMRMQLDAGGERAGGETVTVEITNGEWLQGVMGRLADPARLGEISAGGSFRGTLRRYQQIGLNWLGQMASLRFGSLLADDMGLGKTVQILALLEYLRNNGGARTLLVIPASLLRNWQDEADKFAPELKYSVVHSGRREPDFGSADLVITTYGMVSRVDALKGTEWDLIVLDEAQAIKNSGTKQAKAIKSLKSSKKIAMTGTPIENRLSDLWSIFDFLNRGLLGSAKEFENFAKGLKADIRGYSRLRDIISPFILRRLKTDKAVISDLPEKVEMKAFTALSKKQAVLYGALVKDIERAITGASGIARKGLILSSIMKFKQICNHPDQYLGQKSFDASHSGKFEKLRELCETIAEKRERALVFTQFKEMADPIADYLKTVFGREGIVLHGGTQIKKRGELVGRFNGEEYVPFMVLSLKAGGIGLNLTAANHVIHFDRWWNPAVENQATDRAFRIGQKKNVIVHKFVTAGTIEEKIDAMLEEKQKMANDVIASGPETWITEMGDAELMDMLRLRTN